MHIYAYTHIHICICTFPISLSSQAYMSKTYTVTYPNNPSLRHTPGISQINTPQSHILVRHTLTHPFCIPIFKLRTLMHTSHTLLSAKEPYN